MAEPVTVTVVIREQRQAGAGLTHLAKRGSYVALCGYLGMRHGPRNDPMGQPWCGVCQGLSNGR